VSIARRRSTFLFALLASATLAAIALDPTVIAQRRGRGASLGESAGPFGP
jgi:hypothetical protein